jgi:hypothetical protein
LPDAVSEFDGRTKTLLILDDLMSEANDAVSNIFTKISHHRNVSVIFLSQNLFYQSKHNRTLSLNSHYLILFKNARDASQISVLGKQMYPNHSKFLVDAFRMATEQHFGYMFVDLKPDTLEKYRIRSNIFPNEINYVYVPK